MALSKIVERNSDDFIFIGQHQSQMYQLPSSWQKSTAHKVRVVLSATSDEHKTVVSNFAGAMKGKYKEIVRVERIQNERWYMQYLAHHKDFKRRLNMDSERRLYHGCPEQSANAIIEDCFNRSFAGVNGKSENFSVHVKIAFRDCVRFWCLLFVERSL
jgi:hypothetical protein